MEATNFLQETLSDIKENGQTPETIKFIGSSNGEWGCTWAEFEKLADFTYDNGYGSEEIPTDLIIVFMDGTWLRRGEYDGSEWWNYYRAPQPPNSYKTIINLNPQKTPPYSWEVTVTKFQKENENVNR